MGGRDLSSHRKLGFWCSSPRRMGGRCQERRGERVRETLTAAEAKKAAMSAAEEKKAAMPVAGNRTAGIWEREVGSLPPKRFANAVKASQDFMHSLNIHKRLQKHRGCVNTISFNSNGSLLLSGSDDRTVTLWNWQESSPTMTFHTGHCNNVLHAQFMPFSDDRSIVTAGADGEVRHSQIREGGRVFTDELVELDYAVHRLAVQPGNPHTFFCCGEDGSVWHFDLRGKNTTELFNCGLSDDRFSGESIELYGIAVDPRNPSCFAVCGSDEYVRLYDTRKVTLNGNSSLGRPIEHFCPPHLIGKNKDGVTGLAFSQTGELLASYNFDDIYLFSREHGLQFNSFELGEPTPMDETAGACDITLALPSPPCGEKVPVPQAFKGHQNMQTIKGVSFLGPNCEYVTSGSDCGHLFIWRKMDGELMRVMRGDKHIVNCVEQHPSEIIVASSGIDNDIKIWAPGESENPSLANFDEVHTHFFSDTSSDSDGLVYIDDYVFTSAFDLAGDDEDGGDDDLGYENSNTDQGEEDNVSDRHSEGMMDD